MAWSADHWIVRRKDRGGSSDRGIILVLFITKDEAGDDDAGEEETAEDFLLLIEPNDAFGSWKGIVN